MSLSGRQLVLETLYALSSNTKIIKEAMAKGNVCIKRVGVRMMLEK